ncbi:MAG: PIN domain-containing protein [Candidatus Korarchaeota archaeon]|nr:PIN domain-containing protein [Candidatus Korarchaeota archaeon]
MRYLDTSVVLSAANAQDPNHSKALELLKGGKNVVSELTIAELYSVVSRVVGVPGEELDALVEYMVEASGAHLIRVGWSDVFRRAYVMAGELKLKTLDLLHVSAALVMKAREFVTLDKEIIGRGSVVERLTGVRVVPSQER